jgi:hypothetical protein
MSFKEGAFFENPPELSAGSEKGGRSRRTVPDFCDLPSSFR